MVSLAEQPKNINPLADVQFKFDIAALPTTSFFVQTCNLPGVSLEAQAIGAPRITNFARYTGVITYENLDITFLIDEYLKNWQEIYEWMTGKKSKYTSAVLTLVSSSVNPTLEFHFKEIFPISLSAISFDSTTTDPVYQTASISFNYSEYIIKNLLNN